MKKKQIPAFGYLRVSGISQVDKNGFDRQKEKIIKYAEANNYEIIDFFYEKAISGTSDLVDRPALSGIMLKIAGNGVKTVIVERADRFARDLIASELLIKEFQGMDAKVIEAESGSDLSAADDDNPTSKLIRQILAAVSEFDKNSTVLKLRMARKRVKALNGKCEGRKTFGETEDELEVIKLIKSLRRKKKTAKKRMSWAKIAQELEEREIKTRDGKSTWYPATVRRIGERSIHSLSVA